MKLYFAPGTCALAPHIVLNWIGTPYEAVEVALGDPDYLKINPLGAVPALDDGNGLMYQADAILKYLASKYPDAKLGGDGTLMGDYELDRWLAFLTGDLHPAFYPLFVPARYTTSEEEADRDAMKAAGGALVGKFLSHLDEQMSGRDHVALSRRTVADPYAFAMLRWARPLDEFPNLRRFYDRLADDPGVAAAMSEHGID